MRTGGRISWPQIRSTGWSDNRAASRLHLWRRGNKARIGVGTSLGRRTRRRYRQHWGTPILGRRANWLLGSANPRGGRAWRLPRSGGWLISQRGRFQGLTGSGRDWSRSSCSFCQSDTSDLISHCFVRTPLRGSYVGARWAIGRHGCFQWLCVVFAMLPFSIQLKC